MARPSYGASVVNGAVQYFSASSLTTGDADTAEGCLRRWWYEKVEGRRPPATDAQELGTKLHAELEAYLRGETSSLGALTARGKPMVPTPGPDLLIEHDLLVVPGSAAPPTLVNAPLKLLGIPVVGYIDLVHTRCTNKGVSDIEEIQDPPGTVEVIDWKTTKNPRYIKTAEAMSKTLQMSVYGKWALTVMPEVTSIRLSHGYFVTRGTTLPSKVTVRTTREQIEHQWARVERVAGFIAEAARETNADNVPANTNACDAYGGCPHRRYCRAGAQESLVEFFGPSAADHMLRRLNTVISTPVTLAAQPANKGLRGFGTKKPEITPEVRAEMQRVALEEVEAKYPGLKAQWDELIGCNVGHPAFSGELARVINELTGAANLTADIAGTGVLAKFGPFDDPAELPGLLVEVKAFVAPSLLPPEAPPSDPALASVPPDEPATPAKRRPGRPPGSKTKSRQTATDGPVYDIKSGQALEMQQVEMTYTPATVEDVVVSSAQVLYFYVNCKPSCKYEDFWPYVHELVSELNDAAGDAADFRLVPPEHKFAFGRWKAAITAALAACTLQRGHYVLDNVGGEVGQAVAEAMRLIVSRRGGVFVQ